MKRDTFEDRAMLEDLFGKVCDFCLNTSNSNIFLIEKESQKTEVKKIQELVDLRLIHFVDSRVTVRTHPGKIFEAYMLDISQYSGSRKKRGFNIIEFWKKTESESVRNHKLILPI